MFWILRPLPVCPLQEPGSILPQVAADQGAGVHATGHQIRRITVAGDVTPLFHPRSVVDEGEAVRDEYVKPCLHVLGVLEHGRAVCPEVGSMVHRQCSLQLPVTLHCERRRGQLKTRHAQCLHWGQSRFAREESAGHIPEASHVGHDAVRCGASITEMMKLELNPISSGDSGVETSG